MLQSNSRRVIEIADGLTSVFGLLAFMTMLYELGFKHNNAEMHEICMTYAGFFAIYFFILLVRWQFVHVEKPTPKQLLIHRLWLMFVGLLLLSRLYCSFIAPLESASKYTLIDLSTHITVTGAFLVSLTRSVLRIPHFNPDPMLIFVISFILLIVAGGLALMLPNATQNGISLVDSMFISTSCVCVTGLASVDIEHSFTRFGHTIMLILIQLGGLGILTFTSLFSFLFSSGNSFKNQLFVKEMVYVESFNDLLKNIVKVLVATLLIEGTGAVYIFTQIDDSIASTFGEKVYFSVFHAISAFCNAGFSTISAGLYDEKLRFHYNMHLCIAFLIIMGGIGYPIVFNFYNYFKNSLLKWMARITERFGIVNFAFFNLERRRLKNTALFFNLNTKVVIFTTAVLLAMGTILFWVAEYNNSIKEHHTLWGQFVTAFFGSVTPRTAGFNTVDYATVGSATILITMFLMWVGASPSSTGGGIKTTTFFVATLNFFSIAQGKNRLEAFKREIPDETIRRAFAVISLSLVTLGFGSLLLLVAEPEVDPLRLVFEVFSAYGTVGLSMGLTPSLTAFSKWTLIGLMFIGRVGMLTILIGLLPEIPSNTHYRYPQEGTIIG